MKKLLAFFLVMMAGLMTIQAQSLVVRNDNDYIVDGQVMNKAAFNGYLQNTSPEAYAKFNSGYKLSKTGWGLFGAGLGTEVIAIAMAMATPAVIQGGLTTSKAVGYTTGTALIYIAGTSLTTAGIVCLAVGYGKMHNAADLYNVSRASKPTAELHLTAGANAIGLACRF